MAAPCSGALDKVCCDWHHVVFNCFVDLPMHRWSLLAYYSRSVQCCIALIDCCTVSFTDATFHPDVDADVGDKVTLNCTSPRVNATSVTWRYRSSISNDSSVLFTVKNGIVSQIDTSGRLSLNRTVRNVFPLVIYAAEQSDSGTYFCSVDVGYERQHFTVLRVRGIRCIIGIKSFTEYAYLHGEA